ncbi:MAG: hypothetical protein GC168_11190 [Candidatus Hydrogenedens sp.]|nr:hypothetical protein [Candidatus Hydrogenedens sp.]
MAKKKQSAPAVIDETPYAWWPGEFAPFRYALIHMGFLIALGVLLTLGIQFNSLLWVKQLVGTLIGMEHPGDLGPMPQSLDAGILIWCLCLVGGNTLLHPSLGLVALAAMRPWLDGYTFKTDNTYFLWGAIFILMLWGVRAVLRGEGLRYPVLTLLSLAYIAVALLLSFTSIDFGETYKQLLNWTGYAAVFIVTYQNLQTRRVQRFIFMAVLLAMTAQAIFAILQYYFVLPFLRELIQAQPQILRAYFGVDQVTDEMVRRFNRNRAFGTVLFPNALAGFLVLVVPAAALYTRQLWRERPLAGRPAASKAELRSVLGATAVLFVVLLSLIYSVYQFPISYTTAKGALPWYLGLYAAFGGSLALSVACALPYAALGRKQGIAFANHRLSVLTAGVCFLILAWALLLTFSRAGIISLAAGCAFAMALVMMPAAWSGPLLRWAPRALGILVLLGIAGYTTVHPATAHAQAAGQLTTQGENITLDDLSDTRSLGIRFTYWRVGLSIFADNFLTGVGLGNFKWAYAAYQYLGAGDVQEAHNGYLQAFAETGILGGLALLAFWGYFVLWAAGRVRAEENAERRGMLAALLAGVVAFLLHAALDIHFSHPTLMFFAMMFAGFFVVWSTPEGSPALRATAGQASIAAVLVAAALAFGLSTRPYFQNLALNRMQFFVTSYQDALQQKLDVAHYIIDEMAEEHVAKRPVRPVPVAAFSLFHADPERYAELAKLYEPDPARPGRVRPQPEGSPLTPQSNLLFQRIWMAGIYLVEDTLPWVEELKREDARYPYDFMMALHLAHWYQLYANRPSRSWMKESPEKFLPEMLHWSEEAVRRSPLNAVTRECLAESYLSLWHYTPDKLELLDKYLENAKRSAELAPARAQQQYYYAHALDRVSGAYRARGDEAKADEYRALGDAARGHAWDVLTFGLPPMPRPDENARKTVEERTSE